MTTDRHLELQELLAFYAIGALTEDERAEVERHLGEGCDDCEAELLAWNRTADAVADSVEPVEPSEHVRARVVRAVAGPAPKPEPTAEAAVVKMPARYRWATGLGWGAALAATLALAVTGSAVVELRQRLVGLEESRGVAARQVSDLREELDDARGRLRQAALAARIAASPTVSSVQLAGQEGAPGASGHTLVDPRQRRAIFYVADLPPLESDRTYQLWWIADGEPIDAGVFDIDEQGGAQLLVENVPTPDTIDAWAVTVEPAGGLPKPSGPVVLVG